MPPVKKKRGRPKGNPLSPAERAQREAAPLKTGEHSARLLAKALPPCKTSTCPAEYPCTVKEEIEARGGGLSVCLPELVNVSDVEAFKAAIRSGDTKALGDLAAVSLAAYSRLEHGELAKLVDEGLTIERPIVGRDDLGNPEVIDHFTVENPRAELLIKISGLLGRTADQQVISPKSRGEKAANEGVEKAGQAAWVRAMRRGLTPGEA